MNSRQKRTLAAIFETPTRTDVEWSAIEPLMRSLDAEIKQGSGSRVRFLRSNTSCVFHSPHPERVTDPGAVKSVQDFLREAGVSEEDEGV